MNESWNFTLIGHIRSPFREKFGIPRQSGLVRTATAELVLRPPHDRPESLRGLEAFSHLWLLFVFHAARGGARRTVRPPRLGGNTRLGVFATRSPFRPNPIGLSVVELAGIEHHAGRTVLRLRGIDLLDGTPILDIKPYVPYADSLPQARGGFADSPPDARLQVVFDEAVEQRLRDEGEEGARLRALIEDVIALDPRPAYRQDETPGREYAMRLGDHDVRWRVNEAGIAQVISRTALPPAEGEIS